MIRRFVIAAGVLAVLAVFSASSSAARPTSQLRMVLPCFSTAAWARHARTANLKAVDTRTDEDGDVWIIWVVKSYWRSTLTIRNGSVTCILGGGGFINPARKDNI